MTDDNLTIAYMAGYHDAKSKYADEIERLREALREVARCDFQAWARNALEKDADAQKQTLERIAQYDMQKIAIDALKE
jgi:hypothetical protein